MLEYLSLVSLQALEVTGSLPPNPHWQLSVAGRQTLLLTALFPYLIAAQWLIAPRQ